MSCPKYWGLSLVEGRFFARERSTDAEACLINETTVRVLGLEDPRRYDTLGSKHERQCGHSVRGDWRRTGLQHGIVASGDSSHADHFGVNTGVNTVLAYQYGSIVVKINSSDEANALRILRDQWNQVYPDLPEPEFTLLKDKVAGLYEDDHILRTVFTAGSTVSILIACLGLLGLTAFMVQRRIREIGVRKVMGATVGQVVVLLYREFTLYVLVAWGCRRPVDLLSGGYVGCATSPIASNRIR